jgi:CRP/FNR family transcriptional regulator
MEKMEILEGKEEVIKKFGKFYKKGTILFREGEEGDRMFIIHQGKVRVFRTIKGVERTLAVLEKGDFFGEMAIFTKRPRSASIEVIEDSILIELTEKQLLDFIKEEPAIALKILSIMAKRLENSNKLVENLILKDERTQSLNALIQISEEMERLGKSGEWFRFDPHSFIARAGVSVETAKKVLSVIKKMGFIDVKGKNVKIVNPAKLKEFINFLLWSRATTSEKI